MWCTCFEPEGSSSGRRLCVELWYFMIYMYQYQQPFTLLPTRLLTLMHVKHTLPYLYIQPSSWRWTLGFETCRRYQKLKYWFRKGAFCCFIQYNDNCSVTSKWCFWHTSLSKSILFGSSHVIGNMLFTLIYLSSKVPLVLTELITSWKKFLQERYNVWKDEEQDVSSYWMTLRRIC